MASRMFVRSLVFALAFCIVAQPAIYAQAPAPAQQDTPAQAAAQPDQDQAATAAQPDSSATIKADMKRIGKGNQAIVIFNDGTTHAGRIKDIGKQTFALNEGKSGGSYPYADVSSVTKPQEGPGVGSKVMPIAFLASGLIAVAGMVDFAVTKARGSSSSGAAATSAK